MTRETAYKSYLIMIDTVTQAKCTFELFVSTSTAIHGFCNKYQSTWAAIQVVRTVTDNPESTEEYIEQVVERARHLVNEFLVYVGTKVEYSIMKDEVDVSEARR